MRLALYIRNNMEQILQKWQEHASQLDGLDELTKEQLRDDAKGILLQVASDMEKRQTRRQQILKSKGLAKAPREASSARYHGADRERCGFTIAQMSSEFRALRTSVSQLWIKDHPVTHVFRWHDLVRFHEGIDVVLAESIDGYVQSQEEKERSYRAMLSVLSDLSFVYSTEAVLLYANKVDTSVCGYSLDQAVTKMLQRLAPGDTRPGLPALLQALARTCESCRGELSLKDPENDAACHFDYLLIPVKSPEGEAEAIAGSIRDITDRKAAEELTWRQANFCPVTDIPNRRLFLDRLAQNVKHTKRTGEGFALLFIDLDHFKSVNDRLGHNAGDELLKQVARRLSGKVRDMDTVARLGGDEFTAILLNVTDEESVAYICKDMLDCLAEPFKVRTEIVSVCGSIGAVLCPQDGLSVDELMSKADQAMYQAKRTGRARFCWFEDTTC